jgi:hypothetical protein
VEENGPELNPDLMDEVNDLILMHNDKKVMRVFDQMEPWEYKSLMDLLNNVMAELKSSNLVGA